jgi:hypothetical protein
MEYEDDERILSTTKLPELFSKVDENQTIFLDLLKDAVSIPSISNDPDHFEDILKMVMIFM